MERITPFPPSPAPAGAASPSTFERFARLPALIEPGQFDIGMSVTHLADLLHSFGSPVTVVLTVIGAASTERWHVKISATEAVSSAGAVDAPDVEVITSPAVASAIASGSLSPVVAFGQGRLRIRGDLGLASRLLKHVAATPTAVVDICHEKVS
jgi:hypothetical protein